jgi:hypothetical protein
MVKGGGGVFYTDLTGETNKDTSMESKKKRHRWLLAPKSVETKAGKDEE